MHIRKVWYDTKFKLLVPNGSMDFRCQDFCRRVLRTRGYELRGAAAKAVGAEETLALSFRCTATGTKRHLQPKTWGFHHPTLEVSPWFTDIDRKAFMNMCGFFTSLQMRSLPTMIKHEDVKKTKMVIYHELHTIHCQECGFEEGKLPTVPTRNRDLTTKTSPPKLWIQSDESTTFFLTIDILWIQLLSNVTCWTHWPLAMVLN